MTLTVDQFDTCVRLPSTCFINPFNILSIYNTYNIYLCIYYIDRYSITQLRSAQNIVQSSSSSCTVYRYIQYTEIFTCVLVLCLFPHANVQYYVQVYSALIFAVLNGCNIFAIRKRVGVVSCAPKCRNFLTIIFESRYTRGPSKVCRKYFEDLQLCKSLQYNCCL